MKICLKIGMDDIGRVNYSTSGIIEMKFDVFLLIVPSFISIAYFLGALHFGFESAGFPFIARLWAV